MGAGASRGDGRWAGTRRRRWALAAGFLLVLGIPASAGASSLVYTSGGNVWLANPDGSGQYQVTLDGTAGDPYSSPSQSNDGTIEAIRGTGPNAQIYRMTQNGTLRNAPFSTAVPGTGPLDAVISPDGSKVGLWGVTGTDPCYPWVCYGTARTYQVSSADHYVDPSTFAPGYSGWVSFGVPAWMSNTRNMLFTGSGTMWYYDLGQSEPQQWFQADPTYTWDGYDGNCCNISFEEGADSQDGTRLALVIANGYRAQYQIAVFSATAGDFATGNPPANPTLSSCVIRPPDNSAGSNGPYPGGALFDSLSWSPDDSSLAYEYNGAIYTAHVQSLTDCTQDTITRVISAGSDPYWGPANVNPGSRVKPPPPHSLACQVPNVIGKPLAAAKRAITKAHCKVGTVTKRHASRSKKGRVISQSPRRSTRRPAGAKVNLVVGR